jgi:hypothetical protein
MGVSKKRCVLCLILALTVPSLLLGQTSGAILHAQGGVWVNGYEAHDSTAIFPGDLIETKTGFAANLTMDGSMVLIQAESVTKLGDNLLELDHGAVSVMTSTAFKVKVNCLTVVPVSTVRTEYDVTDVNGTIPVAARKSDVNVEREMRDRKALAQNAGQQGSVREGEQHSYDESETCGAPAPMAAGSGLNPKWIYVGAGGAGLALCLLLCIQHGGGHAPLSSDKP